MKLVLPNVVIGFPHLFTPDRFNDQSGLAYSCRAFIERGSEADKKIQGAIVQVARELWKDKADTRIARFKGDPKSCFYQPGENFDWEKPYEGEGEAGCMVMSARRAVPIGADTGNAPAVVDRNKKPLSINNNPIYSGCIVNLVVDVWAQDSDKGSGIRCTLIAVQFVKDGKPYGVAQATADDFDDLGDDFDDLGDDPDKAIGSDDPDLPF